MFEFDEFFRRMRRMFRELDREFEREFKEVDFDKLSRMPGVRGFKIEIKDYGTNKPEVKVTRLGERPTRLAPVAAPVVEREPLHEEVKKPEKKPIKQMLETNIGKVERLDEVVLTMQTPGVKKEDVETRQVGNTLEVVARKPTGEAFFGVFELPSDAVLSERKIEVKDGMSIVTLPRRRRQPTGR